MKPTCCGDEAIWVENVPGKGYNFCKTCRKEVLEPVAVEVSSNGNFIDLSPDDVNKLNQFVDGNGSQWFFYPSTVDLRDT